MNNNGIYSGLDAESWEYVTQDKELLWQRYIYSNNILRYLYVYRYTFSVPPTSLLYGTRYDKIASAFGARGYGAKTIPELDQALCEVFNEESKGPVIINVEVHPTSSRKAQV